VGEDEGPAQLQVVVLNELWLAVAEVSLPLIVVEDLNMVRWLFSAALLHDGMRQHVPSHHVDEPEGEQEAHLAPARRGARKVVYPFTEV
jgi:hypothetical protein